MFLLNISHTWRNDALELVFESKIYENYIILFTFSLQGDAGDAGRDGRDGKPVSYLFGHPGVWTPRHPRKTASQALATQQCLK